MYKLSPQEDRIYNHLLTHGSITSAEAYNYYGCTRLAAVVAKLKAKEIPIGASVECGIDRYGKATHYARYSIRS